MGHVLQPLYPGLGMLREIRKRPLTGETIVLSAADPLNLAGIVLAGPRIPALGTNSVSCADGVPHGSCAARTSGRIPDRSWEAI